MPHLPPLASAVLTILGVVLAVTRLLTASRPFWDSFPAWVQKLAPALLVALGVIPTALESAKSWMDVVTAVVIAVGTFYTASRGDKRAPLAKDGGPRIERVNSDPKLSADETMKMGPLLILAFCALRLATACHSAPPCNEDKMRAIDAAYLTDLAKACLSYPDAASCPDYLPLKAKHEADLESCPK